jgi:hypothetical protein
MINIPDFLSSKDIIFHYTKASTAVEHILFENRLKFSSVLNSIDPIERERFNLGREYFGTDYSNNIFSETEKDAQTVEEQIENLLGQIKMICFCENSTPEKIGNARKIFKKDDYGFLKPRMRDQYGDKYKGVCLALSKETILANSKIDFSEKVKYVEYDKIALNFSHINLNSLINIGKEKYFENVSEGIIKTFFQKHRDYRDEKEFRLIKKTSNEIEFIDITKAIRCIIINTRIIDNNFLINNIVNYANENGIEVLHLYWDKTGVNIYSQSFINEVENPSR